MTQLLIDRTTLEQLVGALEKHHKQETRYSDNKRRANATCAHFTVNPLQELAEQAYMLTHGKETIEALTAGRAAIANAEPTGWIAVSDRLPLEADGEVLARMRDGRHEIAWATYWHGANTGFAQWTFLDPDEDETPTHWMPLPAAPNGTP